MTIADLAEARARRAKLFPPPVSKSDLLAVLAEAAMNNSQAILMLFDLMAELRAAAAANRVIRETLELRIERLETRR